MCKWLSFCVWLIFISLCRAGECYVETATLPSSSATQAAAADAVFVYAVSSTGIAKLVRATGEQTAVSTGKASHLNSAVLIDGKLYSAHSNFPLKPDQGEIRVLDPKTMKLEIFHRFEKPPGSLTWALKREGSWWCHFAHYGADNGKSRLVRYDGKWRETGRWEYPPEVVEDWGTMSSSGGIWLGDTLLVTGHDKKLIYRLKLPQQGTTLIHLATLPSPFPGQGIAIDPKSGGLVGIDRGRKRVVFAKLEDLPGNCSNPVPFQRERHGRWRVRCRNFWRPRSCHGQASDF